MKYLRLSTLAIAAILLPTLQAQADEGMWLPALISQRIDDMQAKGFHLNAEDLYSIDKASLKDAVVLFGSGCTGELVSDEGLLLTNHHCGYSYIQRHSSVEHDYLKDGFWAMSRDEELPNEGLSVSFLERMEDVTAQVLNGYTPAMTEAQRDSVVSLNSSRLISAVTSEGKGLRASVEALYYGNTYYLFVYKVFKDVRLVGAPPSSIGKFGGDTDNWMWPRHTGDFSIFRVYADKDGNPAEYSPDNVPYHPKKHFTISTAGVNEGDFTLVYGFPGSTREYVHSDEVSYTALVSDPMKIALRDKRLRIQKDYMSRDQAIRIKYSSKNASVANAWKKWQGESGGIIRMGTIQSKQAFEKDFRKWAAGGPYEGLLDTLSDLYGKREPYMIAYENYTETVRAVELLQFAASVRGKLQDKKGLEASAKAFFKDYYQPIDEESFCELMEAFGQNVPEDLQPDCYKNALSRYGSVNAWKDAIFGGSIFTDQAKVTALGANDESTVEQDPAYQTYQAFYNWLRSDIMPQLKALNDRIRLANRDYMRAQMEYEPGKAFYPDANLTLRVTYGAVKGYEPYDGAYYYPVSTLKGIIEKDNPDIFDYNIPQKLRDIYAEGGHDGQSVCFLATNHTSGGNSGSPVINADGELIGLNFDRVWEGTMSDIAYNPDICRNISLDIRYLLFCVDRIGGAGYLLKEMDIK